MTEEEERNHHRAAITLATMAGLVQSGVEDGLARMPEELRELSGTTSLIGAITIGMLFQRDYPAEAADIIATVEAGIGAALAGAKHVADLGAYTYSQHADCADDAP